MKRRRIHSPLRMSRDAERLVWLAQGLAESGSRTEDAYWEHELTQLIERLIGAGQEEALNLALDRLHETGSPGYDDLADLIESVAESARLETPEGPRQGLLIALPVLAWSRWSIPARRLQPEVLTGLGNQLAAHVLAADVPYVLADHLYSPDQLPYGYGQTRRYAERLWQALREGRGYHEDPARLPEVVPYISDVRYVLGAVMVPPGRPVFRWNEVDGQRQQALERWRAQAGPNLQGTLAGCGYELLLPDAYFAAWRRADREGRPYSLRAAVAYLDAQLTLKPVQLRAVAAPFYDRRLEEWRIGFGPKNGSDIVHGVVWPLLGQEDETTDTGAEIERILQAAGVGEVVVLDQRLPLEYCEDCGAPLYANAEGELVHAEMPEQEGQAVPTHLH
ncbi:MAG: DUF2863 family protein [Thiobacillaceae bacterium]|nr:DUF2863 family protein [Thiobacillaceae bacterium]MCX7672370.1 DUF2863 family protein [Thiobacillaceae bacterium]MDW8324550.1 DUF2863 family protein [Burkholderiales bacterium]